jgi:cysteine desulfuration protein SufE
MTKLPSFSDIADNLGFLEDWEDRYKYLIELGQSLPPLAEAEKSPANKVSGCVSQVWLVLEENSVDDTPVLTLRGDSDAMIVKGLVAVLIALYSGRPASEIAKIDAVETLDGLGLREHLTAQRSNGLVSMVGRIRAEADSRLG